MVARKKLITIISTLLIISTFVGCSKKDNPLEKSNKKFKIGISQIVEHPALDSARKGFEEALKSKGLEEGKNLTLDFQSAQGDIATSQMIAQNFVSEKKDLIFAIATPSAQSAFNSTKDIPIMVTAVTDAVKAGIIESKEKSNTNVAGTSDAVPIEKQLKLCKDIFPQAKKIGVLFNTSEVNSEVQIENMKAIAGNFGFEIVTSGVNNVNDMPQALDVLLNKIDLLYTPTDNLVASSMPMIKSKAMDKKIPIIGAEEAHVKAGALITEGVNYYKLGFEAGLMAVDVLEGKNIKDMTVKESSDTELVINSESLEALGVKVPEDILKRAKLIKEGN